MKLKSLPMLRLAFFGMLLCTLASCDMVNNGLKGTIGGLKSRTLAELPDADINIKEGEGATLTLLLNPPPKDAIKVSWTLTDPNTRAVAASGIVNVGSGQTSTSIYIQARSNALIDGDEQLRLLISSAGLQSELETLITILDQTTPAVLSITDSPLYDFGAVRVGLQNTRNFTLTNSGDAAASLILASGLTAPFTFLGGSYPGTAGTCAATLVGHTSCTLIVEYAPTASGSFSDSLAINYNDGASTQNMALNVQGTAAVVVAAFNLATLPTNPSNLTVLNTEVNGSGITNYRYKVIQSSGDCTDSTGYSASRPVATRITDNISLLPEGTLEICVVGANLTLWQPYSAPTIYTWTKDTIAPSAPSVAIASGSNYTTTLIETLTLSATDATDMYVTNTAGCSSGGTWETYATTKAGWSLTTANSSNTVYVGFRDLAGNSACVSDSVIQDNLNPGIIPSLTLGAASVGLTDSPAISFANATDNGPSGIANYQAQIFRTSDNAVIKSWSSLISGDSFSALSLADGVSYYLQVRATDNAGNIGLTRTSGNWTAFANIIATLSGTPSAVSNVTSLNVSVGGTGVTGYSYKLGEAATTDCTSATGYSVTRAIGTNITDSITSLSDGTIKLCAVGTDGSSWQSYASATTYTWTKDTVAPTAPSVLIAANATYITNLSTFLDLSVSSANEMYITPVLGCGSGGAWEAFSISKAYTFSNTNTTNTIYAKFRDTALNETGCVNDSVIHDGSAPNAPTALSLGTTPSSLSQTPTFSYTLATDVGPAGINFHEARVLKNSDSAEILTWANFTSGTALSGLTLVQNEVYRFEVRAVDNAGNVGAIATSTTWIASAPVTATLSGQPAGTNNTATLNATVGGTGVTQYKYKVGTSALDCAVASGYSASGLPIATLITDGISGLADGGLKLCVVGYNGAVWQDYASATIASWTKDTTAPTLPTISINAAAIYTNATASTITLSATAADEMYVTNTAGCASDGAWETYGTTKAWTLGQTNSTATVYAAFRDASGNTTSCINDTIVHDAQNPNAATTLALGTIPASVTASPSISYTSATDVGPAGIDRHQVSIFKTSDNSVVSAYADHSTGTNVSGLTLIDGQQYYAKVRALDMAGNVGIEAQTANWTVNGTLAASLAGTPSNPSSATALNVTVGGTGVNEYKYKVGLSSIDCAAAAGYSAATPIATLITDSVAGLSDGTLKLCAVGGDGLGAFQAYASATAFTWTKDTVAPTAPSISINAAATYTNSTSSTLTLSAAGTPADMYVTNTSGCGSGGAWEAYGTTKAWTLGQTNSTATVYTTFRDAAGNTSTCSSDTIIHDSVSPGDPGGLAIGAVPAKLYQSPTLTFTPGTDSNSGIQKHQVQLTRTSDNAVIAAYADFTSGNSLTGLGLVSGIQYYFKLKAFDNAGNVSNEINSANFTALAPAAILTGQPTSTNNFTLLNITVSGTDVSQYKYKIGTGTLDCSVAIGYSGSAIGIATLITDNISALADGTIKLCAVGGNGTDWQDFSAATTATWIKDTTAPSLPALTINGASSGYTTSASSALAPFAVGADNMYITTVAGCGSGGVFEAYATSKSYTLTANTINTVYIKFSDTSGNVSGCVSASSTHDNQNPNSPTSLTLGGTPQGLTTTPTLSFTAASDVGPAGIQKYQACLIKTSDSSEIAAYADFINGSQLTGLSLLDNTQYRFELKAFDNAGNTSTVVQSLSFTTYTAVTATLSGTPTNPSNATTLNVTVAGSGVSGYSYKVGLASIDCTSSTGYSGIIPIATLITDSISALADGTLKLCVVGTNGTQTQAYASATSYLWVKDTVAPQVLSVASASGNGPFKAGDTVNIKVTFNEITNGDGILVLFPGLERSAFYVSGSGTTEFIYDYIVQTGDSSLDLNTKASDPLTCIVPANFTDALGNGFCTTNILSDLASNSNVVIDTTPPTASTISINSTAPFTNSTSSTLTLSASGADKMYITNVAGCGSGGTLENYATSKAWTLGQTNGTVTVYIQYLDLAGNTTTCVNDTIVHDSVAPGDATALTLGAVPAKLYESPTLTFTSGTDAVSGIQNHQVQVHKTSDNSIVKVYANFSSGSTVTGLSLIAGTQYYFKLKTFDNAGNASNEVSSTNWTANAPTATLSGTPSNPSNATTLAVIVGGTDITFYSYKVGAAASTDCTSATSYSASTPIATNITDSVSGLADGSLKLCVIGSNGTDWQTYASATAYAWTKDTVAPYKNQLALSDFSPPQWGNLLSYYPFDINLNDATLNVKTLTAFNSLATSASPKLFGAGAAQFVSTSNQYGQNASYATSNQVTVSTWIYKTSDISYARFISKGPGYPNEDWYVYAENSGAVSFYLNATAGPCFATVSSTLATAAWHHIVYTYDGISLIPWINGQKLPLVSCSGTISNNASTLTVGAGADGAGAINGTMDDVAVWSTALSESEVDTIYNSQGPTLMSINQNIAATNNLSSTINNYVTGAAEMYITNIAGCSSGGTWEAYASTKAWTLSTANATNTIYAQFRDSAGNTSACVNDMIIHDNGNPNAPSALIVGAAPVGLTSSPTLTWNNATDVGPADIKKYQAQIKRTSDNAIISSWQDFGKLNQFTGLSLVDDVQYYFELRAVDWANNFSSIATSANWIAISSITATLSGTPTNPSNTTTLSVTVGGPNVTVYAYKVGASASTDCSVATGYSASTPIATLITDSISGLADGSIKLCAIGGNGNGWQTYAAATSYTWVKDTVAPAKAATPISSMTIPQAGALVALYPMDGNFNDTSGNASHLTAGNSAVTATTPSLFGTQAGKFVAASSQYASGVVSHTPEFTVSAWIYKVSDLSWKHFIEEGNPAPNYDWRITANDTGAMQFEINRTSGGSCYFGLSSALAISQWHHLVMTYATNGIFSVYVNGALLQSGACAGTPTNFASRLSIGAENGGGNGVDGSMDDVALWNKALTETEIQSIYTTQNNNFLMAINSNAAATNSTSVTLTNYASGATDMYITNTAGCGSGGSWEAFAASKAWTLTATNATNTVYARFRDTAGNTTACVSDSIVHDSSVPTVAITSPAAGSSITVVNQAAFTVSGTCSQNSTVVTITGTVSGSALCSSNVWSLPLDFTSAAAGTVSVTATQTKGSGATASNTRTFTKYANRAPALSTASNQTTTESSAITAIDFNDTNTSNDTDIDTQTITYSCIYDTVIDSAVAGSTACTAISALTFNAATGQIGWTTAINQAGSYEFKVTGSDGTLTDNKIFNIVVNPYIVATLANTPETLSVEANLAAIVGGINITNYKFKIGAAGTTDCTVASGYSGSAISIATPITNAVSSFGPEQSVKLCVVGQHSGGAWQAYASATSYQWTQDKLTTVEIASAYTEITEGNGNTAQNVTLAIASPKPSAMTVYYKISGTAVNGVDHNLATGSLVISASATTASIPFTLYGNALTDGDRSITVALYASDKKFLNFGPNAQLYTILIKDDETTILPATIYSKTQAGHFCMLQTNGKIKCWGRNNNGQVGDGSNTERSSPVAVDAAVTYTKISAGFDHNCGITNAGVLRCWGGNFKGKLGDSTQTASSTPVVFDSGTAYSEVSPGPNFTCAITTGGVLKCVGFNPNAQLGDGTRTDILTPTVIDSGVSYTKVSTGQSNTCGITTGNVLKCWGYNSVGAVGDGTGTGDSGAAWRLFPTVIDAGVSYKNVFLSYDFACGITSTDAVKCWGYNANGQLGTAGTTNQLSPVVVDSGTTYSTLANGVVRTCGITTAGVLKCWGTQYIWSDSATEEAKVTTPTVIDSGTTYVSVAVGRDTVCGITSSKTIKCHGHNRYSSLGIGKTSWLLTATSMDTSVASVSTSDMSACKITTGGALYCLGTPASGLTLGDGTSSVRLGFVAIDATSIYSSLSARDGSYCGITTTGILKCWGSNSNGQIGDGTTTTALVPKVIDAGVSYSSVSAGKTTCGITSANALKCWGSNVDGTVGDVTNTDRLTPTVISSGTNFLSVSTGSGTACAVTSANVLRCWGKNSVGQLGDSTTANKNTPTTIDSGVTYLSVTVGSGNLSSSNTHVCAITTGSALKCWGLNGNGQLGDTTTTTRTTPTLIDSGTLYTSVALGKDATCGITSASKLRCWGSGAYGKLASGNVNQNATPATMDGATNYVKIAIGGSHGFGVTDTGALKTWGYLHNLVVSAGINENAYNPIVNP